MSSSYTPLHTAKRGVGIRRFRWKNAFYYERVTVRRRGGLSRIYIRFARMPFGHSGQCDHVGFFVLSIKNPHLL